MNAHTINAFLDELEKIAGGGAAALGAELLGAPGAAIGGFHEGGLRGGLGAGGGALAGLGVGFGVKHLLHKHLTGGEFAAKHPLLATALEAAPLAVGSTVGGAVGSHIFGKH